MMSVKRKFHYIVENTDEPETVIYDALIKKQKLIEEKLNSLNELRKLFFCGDNIPIKRTIGSSFISGQYNNRLFTGTCKLISSVNIISGQLRNSKLFDPNVNIFEISESENLLVILKDINLYDGDIHITVGDYSTHGCIKEGKHWAGRTEINLINYEFKGKIKDYMSYNGYMKYRCKQWTYEGSWSLGKRHIGKLISNNGDCFDGEFKDDLVHDGAVKVTIPGTIFEGTLMEGKSFNGLIEYQNGDYFMGELKNCKPYNGEGKMTYAEGNYFEGSWLSGKFYNGKGKYKYQSGDHFTGEWLQGFWHIGKGRKSYINNNHFEGYWKGFCQENRKKERRLIGKYTYACGGHFDGEVRTFEKDECPRPYAGENTLPTDKGLEKAIWRHGRIWSGKGKMIFRNGDHFVGEWLAGEPYTGSGKITTGNRQFEGDIIERSWYNVTGKVMHPDGENFEGKWVSGNLMEGHGTHVDGTMIFRGSVKNGKWTGQGAILLPDGRFDGHVIDNVRINGTGRQSLEHCNYREGSWRDGVFYNGGIHMIKHVINGVLVKDLENSQ